MPGAYPTDPAYARPEIWLRQEPAEAYGLLEGLADQAQRARVLDALPLPGDSDKAGDYAIRGGVIGERLWLLGYLDGTKADAKTLYQDDRPAFLQAVTRFQRDSGLKQDAWCGKLTWAMLQGLVSFEDSTIPLDTGNPDSLPPALSRALQLRLVVLGLSRSRPGADFTAPDTRGIRQFQRILVSLKLVAPDAVAKYGALDAATVKYLMDHDGVTAALGALAVPGDRDDLSFRFYAVRSWNTDRHVEMMRGFIVQLAKIELWLLGFAITLDDEPDYPVFRFGKLRPRLRPDKYELGQALTGFYTNLAGLPDAEARQQAKSIRPGFFRLLQGHDPVSPDTQDAVDEDAAVRLITETVSTQQTVDQSLDEGSGLGMRIWDGMKRLWAWFKRQVTRVFQVGRNALRAFYRYATKGFQILKRAIQAFVDSVDTYSRGVLTTPSGHSGLLLGKDFDTRIMIDPGDPQPAASWLGERARLFAERFRFAARILATVINAMVNGTLQHWARFARALVANLRALLPLYRGIQQAEAALGDPLIN